MSASPTYLASAVAAAEQIVEGTSPKRSVTAELSTMAHAVLAMHRHLILCRDNDRTRPYEPGESRPDGIPPPIMPNVEYDEYPRWNTPSQIVDQALGPVPEQPEETLEESAR